VVDLPRHVGRAVGGRGARHCTPRRGEQRVNRAGSEHVVDEHCDLLRLQHVVVVVVIASHNLVDLRVGEVPPRSVSRHGRHSAQLGQAGLELLRRDKSVVALLEGGVSEVLCTGAKDSLIRVRLERRRD